jgi:tryptophanyl-tRNA synthetase
MYIHVLSIVDSNVPENTLPNDSMTFKTAAMLLALGIDPNKSTLFCQSQVKYHDELSWILSCMTPIKWLKGKELKGYYTDNKSVASYTAEIMKITGMLLYRAEDAVFGASWLNTIELAGDLADGLNIVIGKPCFNRPKLYKAPYYAVYKINDLQNESIVMSRVNKNKRGSLYLDDSVKDIREKVIRAKSDSIKEVVFT